MKRFLLILLLVTPGVAAQPFEGLTEAVESGTFGEIKAVAISRHGELIYEQYFRGAQPDDLHQVQSITKSVGSAVLGVAHRKGLLSLDQDMTHIFAGLYDMSHPDLQDKRPITIDNLLTQRHGLLWDEASSDYRDAQNPANQMIASPDWYRYVLETPLAHQPGENFAYSTGASTLMSRVVRAASGRSTEEFAQTELFEPLGITDYHWEGYSEGGMGTGMTQWPNPDADVPLGFGLWLRARDLVKFGELYLNEGIHDGKRILDKSWVDASWSRHSHAGNSDYESPFDWGHGYQWWMMKIDGPLGRPWHVYFASGWGSQVIFVLPELDLVVATVADNYDHSGPDVDTLLMTYVLPALNPRLDSRFNGSWYDPATDGQGFSMEVLDGRGELVSYWYTYTNTGEQRWFVLAGPVVDGVGEVTVYETSGGRFLQSTPPSVEPWGSARFVPLDCNHMNLEVDSDEITTTLSLTRLSGDCYSPAGW